MEWHVRMLITAHLFFFRFCVGKMVSQVESLRRVWSLHPFFCSGIMVRYVYTYIYISGQIIATSHDRFPLTGGLVREILGYFRGI